PGGCRERPGEGGGAEVDDGGEVAHHRGAPRCNRGRPGTASPTIREPGCHARQARFGRTETIRGRPSGTELDVAQDWEEEPPLLSTARGTSSHRGRIPGRRGPRPLAPWARVPVTPDGGHLDSFCP